ncbi:effector-associated constant component EACC1 [Streptomyces acidicola]|uniref:Uncharacterized protein n=1 Tax=Streptomyces acidicola TaxID=2596892 RepID=A0A5N8WWZ1_9ACTN|nr:hypothetical protein [Streptomyces acidicola]MPY51336.1 hypothetical protein [Streptomyces acidicola]
MRITITVRDGSPGRADTDDLRRWLGDNPALRGRIRRPTEASPQPGTMGVAADALLALLAPGGVATVLAGGLIAWLQTRKGSQTVVISRPDGTEITVTSTHVRALDARQTAELAQQLATDLEATADTGQPGGTPDASDAPSTGPGSTVRRPAP